jgi:hypothetical protein
VAAACPAGHRTVVAVVWQAAAVVVTSGADFKSINAGWKPVISHRLFILRKWLGP